MDEDIKPLSEFQANVTTFLDKVHKTKRPLIITKDGKSAAVILDVFEYRALLELLTDIQTGEAQINEGLGIEHEEAKKTGDGITDPMTILCSPVAIERIAEIPSYIRRDTPSAAGRWVKAVFDKVEALRDFA